MKLNTSKIKVKNILKSNNSLFLENFENCLVQSIYSEEKYLGVTLKNEIVKDLRKWL